jgi:hypothetical protein
MRTRILELALENLESRKVQIDAEIVEIKNQLAPRPGMKPIKKEAPKKRKISAAARKATIERMKAYWAAKRKEKAAGAKRR